jgi:hypothetical protein
MKLNETVGVFELEREGFRRFVVKETFDRWDILLILYTPQPAPSPYLQRNNGGGPP